MQSSLKIAAVLGAGLASALIAALLLSGNMGTGIKPPAERLADFANATKIALPGTPAELLRNVIQPARIKVRELSRTKDEGSDSLVEIARETTVIVGATEQLLSAKSATPEEREQAEEAELETLFLAARVSPMEFGTALTDACQRVVSRLPGSGLAANADAYLFLFQHLGEQGGDHANAMESLRSFAKAYPGNRLGVELFATYAQRHDEETAGKILQSARQLYSEGPLALEIDQRLAALRAHTRTSPKPIVTKKARVANKTDSLPQNLPAKSPKIAKSQAKEKKSVRPTTAGQKIVIAGPTLGNSNFSTARWNGKVVLVDFWATWCGPCVRELPEVKRVYEKYHRQGLEVVSVSLDNDEGRLQDFVKQAGIAWPQIFFADSKDRGWNNPIAQRFGIRSIPTMFLLDRSGRLVTTDLRGEGVLERAVEEQLTGTLTARRN